MDDDSLQVSMIDSGDDAGHVGVVNARCCPRLWFVYIQGSFRPSLYHTTRTCSNRYHTQLHYRKIYFPTSKIKHYRYTGATQRTSGPYGSTIPLQAGHVSAMEALRPQPGSRSRHSTAVWRASSTIAFRTTLVIDTTTFTHAIAPSLAHASTH